MFGRFVRHGLPFAEQVLSSAGTFGTVILGARFLGVADQGALGLLFLLLALNTGVMVSFLFQPATVAVHGSMDDGTGPVFRRRFTSGGAVLTALVVPLYGLIWWALVAGSGRVVELIELVVVVLALLFVLAADFQRRSAYVLETPREAFLVSSLTTPPRLLALALLQPDTLITFFIILIATAAPGALLVARGVVLASCGLAETVSFLRNHTAIYKVLLVVGPLTWLCQAAPIQLLGLTYDITFVGILTTLRSITNAANLIIEVVDTQFVASLARIRRERGPTASRRLILRLGTPIFVLWMLGGAALDWFGPDLVRWLAGETYAAHAWLLLPLWGSSLTLLAYRVSSVYFQTAEQRDTVALGYGIGAAWSLIASVALVLPFGLTGAAWALMIGGLGIVVGQFWASTRRQGWARPRRANFQ